LAGGAETTEDADKSWIRIIQSRPEGARPKGKAPQRAGDKPQLLVGPRTTETEWFAIGNLIVELDVFVSRVDENDLPRELQQLDKTLSC
jgi:hypothetical protein